MPENENRKYSKNQVFWIKSIYLIFIIIWIIIICYFKLYNKNSSIVLFIPPLLFLISFLNIDCFDYECTRETFQTTFVFVGIIFSLPLLKWLSTKGDVDFKYASNIIMLAVMLIMLSYLHICISYDFIMIWKHCRSCLEIMSITLFIYTISLYFLN